MFHLHYHRPQHHCLLPSLHWSFFPFATIVGNYIINLIHDSIFANDIFTKEVLQFRILLAECRFRNHDPYIRLKHVDLCPTVLISVVNKSFTKRIINTLLESFCYHYSHTLFICYFSKLFNIFVNVNSFCHRRIFCINMIKELLLASWILSSYLFRYYWLLRHFHGHPCGKIEDFYLILSDISYKNSGHNFLVSHSQFSWWLWSRY